MYDLPRKCARSGASAQPLHRVTNTTDAGITYRFKTLAANGLYQLDYWKIGGNEYSHATDMIGPYNNLNAVNNANGDRTNQAGWTGGCHGYNGDQTGTPTAETISRKIIIDGNEISANGTYYCNSIVFKVKNGIQGNNTCLSAGGGRIIINEETTYTICGNRIKVSNVITPLENVTLYTYYGMQLAVYTNYYVLSNVFKDVTNGGSLSINPNLIVGYDNNTQVAMKMEKLGIGEYTENVSSRKMYIASNKGYYNPINENINMWVAGEKHYFVGEYIFGNCLEY
jgi:hypothetical protein